MANDWRRELGFSDRLASISRIAKAIEHSNADITPARASSEAKSIEEAARRNASSLTQYHASCAESIENLMQTARHQKDSAPIIETGEDIEPSGRSMGRFVNVRHYRDGLHSEVFTAHNPDTKTVVALKFTTPELMQPPHDSVREARILSALTHKHIVPLLETFREAGGHFILVFPYLPFGLDILLRRDDFDDNARRSVLRDLFSGLDYLHEHGIIHRDVKPSNVLLASPTGPAYLADFGTVWSPVDPACEPAGEKILDVGTTCYRPPELLFGNQSYTTKLDMWAAGCLAAQVVCLNRITLFDSGDLGSELALIRSMFESLGTPDLKRWPEAASFPDWGKMNFTQYPAKPWTVLLPGASQTAIDLVQGLVVYESSQRLTAKQVLQHRWLC